MERELFELGTIQKTFRTNGEVEAKLITDDPMHYKKLKHLFLENITQKKLPYFIETLQIQISGRAVIKFEGIDTKEQAEEIIGNRIHCDVKELPSLKGNKYYFHELLGNKIVDENLGELGIAKELYETAAGTLLSFEYKNKEVLIPIHDDIILSFDKTKELISTRIPDGLIDIYLEEKNEN